jgi:hypothetical protein
MIRSFIVDTIELASLGAFVAMIAMVCKAVS